MFDLWSHIKDAHRIKLIYIAQKHNSFVAKITSTDNLLWFWRTSTQLSIYSFKCVSLRDLLIFFWLLFCKFFNPLSSYTFGPSNGQAKSSIPNQLHQKPVKIRKIKENCIYLNKTLFLTYERTLIALETPNKAV